MLRIGVRMGIMEKEMELLHYSGFGVVDLGLIL